jgi:hypothetical protein
MAYAPPDFDVFADWRAREVEDSEEAQCLISHPTLLRGGVNRIGQFDVMPDWCASVLHSRHDEEDRSPRLCTQVGGIAICRECIREYALDWEEAAVEWEEVQRHQRTHRNAQRTPGRIEEFRSREAQ